MRLWTIQHEAVLDVLRERGVFRADGRRIMRDFREAYAWLREQVKARVRGAKGRPLIWAWHQPKPDLRHTGLLYTGTPGVRIELEVPDDRVLLSDFDGWHFRLSRHYLPTSRKDGEAFDRRWGDELVKVMGDRRFRDLKVSETDAILLDEREASWERMFDLPLMAELFRDPEMVGPDREPHVQAVLEHFTADEIRGVTHFKAR